MPDVGPRGATPEPKVQKPDIGAGGSLAHPCLGREDGASRTKGRDGMHDRGVVEVLVDDGAIEEGKKGDYFQNLG